MLPRSTGQALRPEVQEATHYLRGLQVVCCTAVR